MLKEETKSEISKTLNMLAVLCHEIARAKGFYLRYDEIETVLRAGSNPENAVRVLSGFRRMVLAERLALIHSEVSEGLEAVRLPEGHPDANLPEELADVLIRCLDLAASLEIDLGKALMDKIEKNQDRPFRHGKEF